MYEVEVKAYLRNRKQIKEKLEALGAKFSEELHQVDHIFLPGGTKLPPPFGTPVLRVRNENGKHIFTLKISQNNRTDSIEEEIEIKDGEKMVEILKLIGWEEAVMVDKIRIKAKLKEGIEVTLDNVKDLGEFIEAEKMVNIEDAEIRKTIQFGLLDFLESVGVPPEDHVIEGKYDIMLEEIYKKK
jgi:predicted adenylyl cyclase CyaB